ncbi:nucleic acid/nucleotide deaminase domain-containing protein [Actinomadura rudentiformis]|uniref:Uncharacterized protein n=1 Tax=Actinomadura rudentiformis TaxID=359158 RepID=A0A6H9Z3B2_9ACTN|nr:nucleic acid/nucleotide deaminase domain-containing protein [Actinomadura rudentiformis]KAB2347840.1 hypothetical protein F8566_18275 [Actinomadura rudentiformis]
MGKGGGKGGTGKVAGEVGGIFGKAGSKLFRFKHSPDGKVLGLDPKNIDPKTRERWRNDRKSQKPGPGDKVTSRKLDPDDPNLDPKDREMMDAVEKSRQERGDSSGNNYAAIRYVDTDGKERILVTNSDGVHSERMGGNYLLDNGIDPNNIRGIYTERSPCDINSSYCDQWIKKHAPNADVSHRFDYGIDGTSKYQANSQHRKYREGLF